MPLTTPEKFVRLYGSKNIEPWAQKLVDDLNFLTPQLATISAGGGGASAGIGGISAGTTVATSGTVFFKNTNNVSFGLAGSVITATATFAGAGGDGFNILAAGTQTAGTATTVKFADSNGLVWGMSNSTQITGSYTQSTHSHATFLGALSAGTQQATSGTVVFSDSNGLAFGMSNSSVITGSYSQSTHSHATFVAGIAGSNTTYTSGTVLFSGVGGGITVSSNTGQRIDLSVATPVVQSTQPVAASAANGSFLFSTLGFSNSNLVSFGTTAGGFITANVPIRRDFLLMGA